MSDVRLCPRCKKDQPLDLFLQNPKLSNRRRELCKQCRSDVRKNEWCAKYGINSKTFDHLKEEQEGRCKICKRLPKPGSRLQIDHDHNSGLFRGLICVACNNALACVGDNIDRLYALIDYLEEGCQEFTPIRMDKGARTHCPYGHEFNEMNTRWYRNHRRCRECDKIRSQRLRDEAKASAHK